MASLSLWKRNKINKATATQDQQTAKRGKLRDMKTLQAWKLFKEHIRKCSLDRPDNCLEINNLNYRSSSKYFMSFEFVIVDENQHI